MNFKYEGFNVGGQVTSGEVEASSREAAAESLRDAGLYVQQLKEVGVEEFNPVLPQKQKADEFTEGLGFKGIKPLRNSENSSIFIKPKKPEDSSLIKSDDNIFIKPLRKSEDSIFIKPELKINPELKSEDSIFIKPEPKQDLTGMCEKWLAEKDAEKTPQQVKLEVPKEEPKQEACTSCPEGCQCGEAEDRDIDEKLMMDIMHLMSAGTDTQMLMKSMYKDNPGMYDIMKDLVQSGMAHALGQLLVESVARRRQP